MSDWTKPQLVDGLALAFGGDMRRLLPPMAEIPEDFKRHPGRGGARKWVQFQNDWFFSGLANIKATPRDGIDEKAALRHLGAIQRSWEPPHEHKQAAVAWLASLWFADVEYAKVRP